MILFTYCQFYYYINSSVKQDIFLVVFMKKILILLLIIIVILMIIFKTRQLEMILFKWKSELSITTLTNFFNGDLWTQMNNRDKFPVTNIVEILTDIKLYNTNFKDPICMKGAISGTIIVHASQGLLRVQDNTKKGYINMLCFYSLNFMITLLYKK